MALDGRARLLAALPWFVLAAAVVIFARMYLRFVPGAPSFGPDYSLHLPNMLAGYFHFLANGPLSPPWFTPAQCGGVPYLADLNVAYYSVPQWTAFAIGPVWAIEITFIIFAAAGAAGMYLLARSRFGLSMAAALLCAVVFLFNGFYTHRMAVGHLTFHPFMLTPWIPWLLLSGAGREAEHWGWPRTVAVVTAIGIVFAYSFQAGMVHLIVPTALVAAVITLIHGYLRGASLRPWLLLAAGGILAMAVSAQRMAASLAFGKFFSRDLYPLPGFSTPFEAMWFAVVSLFWRPPYRAGMEALENSRWSLERHEWEYGVGPAAGLLVLIWLVIIALTAYRLGGTNRPWRTLVFATPIAAILAVPLLLNWYEPGWNALLKETPIIKSSVSLVRWYSLYIPIVALACGLALNRILLQEGLRWAGLALVAGATVGWHATERPIVNTPPYDGQPIVAVWSMVHKASDIPPTSDIGANFGPDGRVLTPLDRNNAMAFGYSQLACYQPIFGYGLETFPIGSLHPGGVLDRRAGFFNIKNPACYLFPKENNCSPGSHFTEDQIDEVVLFAQYHNYRFVRSRTQTVADTVNLIALLGTTGILAIAAVAAWQRRRTERGTAL